MTAGGRNLAELLSASLEAKPRPIGAIRRIPQI